MTFWASNDRRAIQIPIVRSGFWRSRRMRSLAVKGGVVVITAKVHKHSIPSTVTAGSAATDDFSAIQHFRPTIAIREQRPISEKLDVR
jgi:hypothetical protein